MRVLAVARRLTAFACVALASCDNPAETKSFTVSLSVDAATIGQGDETTVGITVERSNFHGEIALTAVDLPSGVTATFFPAVISGTTGTLTIAAEGTAAPGTTTVTVRATGEGVAEQSEPLQLTVVVTGTFGLDVLDGTLTVAQGGGGNTAILVTRNGGYAGDVAVTLSGVPAGITAILGEPSTTGNSIPVTLTASSSVATGVHTITATGTTPGLPNVVLNFNVNVITPPATASLTLTFCSASMPTWLAYKNEGANWQVATPNGNSFVFSATDRLGVAMTFLSQSGADKQVTVTYVTRAEVATQNGRDCRGSNTLTGSVANVGTGQQARVAMGVVITNPPPTESSPSFTLEGVPSRTLDLVATRGALSGANEFTPDRMIVRRGLSPTDGSTIPALDFNGTESFSLQPFTVTLANTSAADALTMINTFWTSTATFGAVQSLLPETSSFQAYGVPSSQQLSGDVHEMYLDAFQSNALVGRTMLSYFSAPGDRTETFGPIVGTPTISTITREPYLRLRGRLALQPEYPSAGRFAVYQEPGPNDSRFVIVVVTAGFLGGSPSVWDIAIPDFTGLTGFSAAWMPESGQTTAWQAIGYNGRAELIFEGNPNDGDVLKFSDRQGTISPFDLSVRNVLRLPRRGQYFRR